MHSNKHFNGSNNVWPRFSTGETKDRTQNVSLGGSPWDLHSQNTLTGSSRNERAVRLGNMLGTFWTADRYGNVPVVPKEETDEPSGRLGARCWCSFGVAAGVRSEGVRPAGADTYRTVSQSCCAKMKTTSRLGRPPPPDKALHMRANSNNTSTTCSKTLLMCVCF